MQFFYDYGFDLYEGLCNFYVYGLDAYLVCSNLVPHQISICGKYRQTDPATSHAAPAMPRLSGLASPHCFRCGSGLPSRERFPGLALPPPTLSGTARLCWGVREAAAEDAEAAGEGGRARFRGGRPFLEPPAEPSLALPSGGRGACNDREEVQTSPLAVTPWGPGQSVTVSRGSLIPHQSFGKSKGRAICDTVSGVYCKRCHCKLGHL